VELEKYDTLTVNELISKLKSAEVDRGMTAKLKVPTDSHSLALVGGSKGKANTNPSTRMFSLYSLMSMPDEEFDVLGEDDLALLTRRFERLHESRVSMRRNTRTCFQCGKPGHSIGKGQILWDVTADNSYVQPMNFLAPGSRDMFDANNKAVD
jgi:hypothetical protein